jgi:hypothetical protein
VPGQSSRFFSLGVTCAVLNYAAARHDEAALTVIQLQPYLTFQMILQSMVALVCMPGFSGSKLTGIALDIAIFTWGCRRVTDFSRLYSIVIPILESNTV